MPKGNPKPEYIGKPPEAVRAFQVQRTNANRRGIPFLFTFEEWWEWWQIDDRWSNRGMGSDKFVMARKGDAGPYSAENVYCATHAQNYAEVPSEVRSRSAQSAWINGTANTPFTNRGEGHPCSIPIETPAGRFGNATEAAEHFGITRQGIRYRIKAGIEGWSYARER